MDSTNADTVSADIKMAQIETVAVQTTEVEAREPLTKFTSFEELPLEVQRMIIDFSCAMNGRVVELILLPASGAKDRRYITTSPVPAILHVNYKVRKEALRSYQLSFIGMFENRRTIKPKIYFNFFADTLYLNDLVGGCPRLPWMLCKDMRRVKSLVTGTRAFDLTKTSDRFRIKQHTRQQLLPAQGPPTLDLSKFKNTFPKLDQLCLMDGEYPASRSDVIEDMRLNDDYAWAMYQRSLLVQQVRDRVLKDPFSTKEQKDQAARVVDEDLYFQDLSPGEQVLQIVTSSWSSGLENTAVPEIRLMKNINEVALGLNLSLGSQHPRTVRPIEGLPAITASALAVQLIDRLLSTR